MRAVFKKFGLIESRRYIAVLLNVIGDMASSYANLNGTYFDGHPLELLYHYGYMLFALAFYVPERTLNCLSRMPPQEFKPFSTS